VEWRALAALRRYGSSSLEKPMSLFLAYAGTLFMLILLQAVLGFDNLLYISLESKRVAPAQQKRVRQLGIGLAIGLRIGLLFVIYYAIGALQNPMFALDWPGILETQVSGHALIVLFGGGFILYTAIKEMYEVLGLFILFLVGVMLVTEGGHLAHLKLLDQDVQAMSKSTFYFVLAVLIVVDLVQSRYQKKINLERARTDQILGEHGHS
jgi:predicted tellurium resistance membrane protein TerC